MLQQPDRHTQEILDLANFLDELPPDRYEQNRFLNEHGARCACGWQNYRKCRMTPEDTKAAADDLGLSDGQAGVLFGLHPFRKIDSKQMARTLRHLAVTGEIDLGGRTGFKLLGDLVV